MRTVTLAAIFLPVIAFGAQRVDVTTTEKTDFAPGGTVRIEGSTGEVNVEGWDQPTVEVEVVRSAWFDPGADHEAKAKARLNAIQVTKKLEGRELTITTDHKHFTGAHVDYRIHVPVNTKLVIHHGIGDVVVFGVEGDIDATAKTGDLVVQLRDPAKYQIDAFTKLGSIYTDYDGAVRLRRMHTGESQNVAAEGPGDARHISLHVNHGGISIQKVSA
jgi:hypothetical protein